MKVSNLKTEQRTEQAWNRQYNIVAYGRYNDNPQKWLEAVSASGTASTCVDRFSKFIMGNGFNDPSFYKFPVNERMTSDKLLRLHAKDLAQFYGFAMHVNYNALYEKTEINYVPFENIRFFYDGTQKRITKYAIHPDWGKRNQSVKRFEDTPIIFVDFYNPDPAVIREQIEATKGDITKWNGQLMYCSMAGDLVYPVPCYDAVISDISTEDAVASVKNRNAKNNFLPAGMLVIKGKKGVDTDDNKDAKDFNDAFKAFQGAENACKIIKVDANFDEEVPSFVPFDSKNFDKEFDYSEKSVQENIGKVFMQPAVLRGEMIAGKLGTSSEIKDATDFYNSITNYERQFIEESYARIFDGFAGLSAQNDFTIIPIEYAYSNISGDPISTPDSV